MGVTEDENALPEQYWCELCKPENHKELLEQVARGEKPWEEKLLARLKAEEEKGKKGKKGAKKGKSKKSDSIPASGKEDTEDIEMPDSKDHANGNGAAARGKRVSTAGKRKSRGGDEDSEFIERDSVVSPISEIKHMLTKRNHQRNELESHR
jgi:hypothetical protein